MKGHCAPLDGWELGGIASLFSMTLLLTPTALSGPQPPTAHSHLDVFLGGFYKDIVLGPFGSSFGEQRVWWHEATCGNEGERECQWGRGESANAFVTGGMAVSSYLLFHATR